MNKLLEQKERGETILFTELLKEIPENDILLELFPNQERPGYQIITQKELEILKLRLERVPQKDIAEQMGLTLGQVVRCIQKVKIFLAKDIPPYVLVNIPLLNPRLYAEKSDVLSERQRDVWVLYAQGYTRQQISKKLGITPSAVAGHISHADRRFREHDQYCAAEKRNLESADLPLTRGEIKIIIKALCVYEKKLEEDMCYSMKSDWKGKLPFETQIVADLYEKAQTAIYGNSSSKLLPNLLD